MRTLEESEGRQKCIRVSAKREKKEGCCWRVGKVMP